MPTPVASSSVVSMVVCRTPQSGLTALLAAADGEYDRRELRILKKIASTADIDETELKALFDWVAKGWDWHSDGVVLTKLSARNDSSSE